MNCPICHKEIIEKKNGIESLVIECSSCKTELVKCLLGLVPKDKFREMEKEYNG